MHNLHAVAAAVSDFKSTCNFSHVNSGDSLEKTLLGSLEVLEASSRSLDKEYRYGRCKCWKHLAEIFGISKEEYESFKCNQVHSPTEVMFEYLGSVMPDITVGDLKDGLAKIERQDVTDILIKHETCEYGLVRDTVLSFVLLFSFGNDDKNSCLINCFFFFLTKMEEANVTRPLHPFVSGA